MMLSPCFHREKAKKLLKGSCCEKVSIKRGLDWMPWPLKHLMLLIGATLAFTRFLHFSTFHLKHKWAKILLVMDTFATCFVIFRHNPERYKHKLFMS